MMTVDIQIGGVFNSLKTLNGLQQVSNAAKKAAGFWIRDRIRLRVGKSGKGAKGMLRGYSKRPIRMSPPNDPSRLKPIISPKKGAQGGRYSKKGGGGSVFFRGGYKEYKQKTGQVSDRFTMTNKGHFWRDWKILTGRNYKGSVEIGWSREANAAAADKAYDGGRSHMFDLNDREMKLLRDSVGQELQKVLTRMSRRRLSKL
jgi:hypothetical protein